MLIDHKKMGKHQRKDLGSDSRHQPLSAHCKGRPGLEAGITQVEEMGINVLTIASLVCASRLRDSELTWHWF